MKRAGTSASNAEPVVDPEEAFDAALTSALEESFGDEEQTDDESSSAGDEQTDESSSEASIDSDEDDDEQLDEDDEDDEGDEDDDEGDDDDALDLDAFETDTTQARTAGERFTKTEDAPAPAGAPAAASAAAAPATTGDAKAAPAWEPLSVNVDKQAVTIEEASISRANGVVYVAMPEKDFGRFQSRISRGVVGERMWRELQKGLKEVEAMKAAPRQKSPAEIQNELTYAMLKPYVPEFLTESEIENLELKIALAIKEEGEKFAQAETARIAEATKEPEPSWEQIQHEGLLQTLIDVATNTPELADLTAEELEDVYRRELLPARDALVFRDNDGAYANTELMHRLLTNGKIVRRASRTAPPTTPPASASPRTPASAGNSTDNATVTGTSKAERFNRGVDSSAAPRTTSVKAGRDSARPAKANTRDTTRRRPRRRPARDEQMVAEDKLRQATRNWINSDNLDFDDGE